MVAGIILDPPNSDYAITLSTAPFSGDILLQTVLDDFLYFYGEVMHPDPGALMAEHMAVNLLSSLPLFTGPTFVSLYENGDFYYLFMTESPVETSQHVSPRLLLGHGHCTNYSLITTDFLLCACSVVLVLGESPC